MTVTPQRPRCTLCPAFADCLHLVRPTGDYPRPGQPVEVRLSCPGHDLGGYWLFLFEGTSSLVRDFNGWMRHLDGKKWAGAAAIREWLATTPEGVYVRRRIER